MPGPDGVLAGHLLPRTRIPVERDLRATRPYDGLPARAAAR